MTQVLQSHLSKMPATLLLKAVYSLCLLGHFPSAPLEQLLQSQTLEELSAIGQPPSVSSDTPSTQDECLSF